MPRHINPADLEHAATAPYNFVPLPERVYTVSEASGSPEAPWRKHDQFAPDTHSGWIDLTIETLTPLYIRGPVSQAGDGTWVARASRLRSEPYTTPDGTPAIPGSSLRGMVRTLVEILSFSKIEPVTDASPFYRSVADDRIGRAYRDRILRAGQKPFGGILCIRDGSVTIAPREVVRVTRSLLQSKRVTLHVQTPPWPPQHGQCWVRMNRGSDTVIDIHIQDTSPGADWRGGILVLTGTVPNKKREFAFLEPSSNTVAEIQVPQQVWERFHDDDQITQWQEKAFPRRHPKRANRPADGHLRDGEPVFFLIDSDRKTDDNPDGLVFLGRAGMFRLPYDSNPRALVPTTHSDDCLDLAEAIFGKVETQAEKRSRLDEDLGTIKGRVYFEDATATHGGPRWYEPELVPQILSAPKPTAFQHYLTQDGARSKSELTTYLDGDHTTIRGHKLYWHRWDDDHDISQIRDGQDRDLLNELRNENPKDTQHTVIRPVKTGIRFAGRIRFENLTALELGVLLHAVQLPEGCCHRIGMGKPLGLGSVRISARLRLVQRATRYRSWQSQGIDANEDGSRFRDTFGEEILNHARASNETLLCDREGLRQIARLDALYSLLAWDRRPDIALTGYMELKAFKKRPVLPTPHAVLELPEPEWQQDPPRPAKGASTTERHRGPQGEPRGSRPPFTQETRSITRSVPAPSAPKPVEKGQVRTGTLRRIDGRWIAIFDGDPREAHIENGSRIPTDCSEGARAEFHIVSQSKRDGIRCRLERFY